jgi:hypothetical protein
MTGYRFVFTAAPMPFLDDRFGFTTATRRSIPLFPHLGNYVQVTPAITSLLAKVWRLQCQEYSLALGSASASINHLR